MSSSQFFIQQKTVLQSYYIFASLTLPLSEQISTVASLFLWLFALNFFPRNKKWKSLAEKMWENFSFRSILTFPFAISLVTTRLSSSRYLRCWCDKRWGDEKESNFTYVSLLGFYVLLFSFSAAQLVLP